MSRAAIEAAQTGTAPSFWSSLKAPSTVKRAAKVGLVVGTVLNIINQGGAVIAGSELVVWQALLTYCVPYCVSSYSSAALLREIADLAAVQNSEELEAGH